MTSHVERKLWSFSFDLVEFILAFAGLPRRPQPLVSLSAKNEKSCPKKGPYAICDVKYFTSYLTYVKPPPNKAHIIT